MATCAAVTGLQALLNLVSWLTTSQSPTVLPHQLDGDRYDFIIVGAGSAGCVLANRLSEESSWRILLLEAGGEEPNVAQIPAFDSLLFGSKLDWNYTTEPQNFNCDGHGCKLPRGKVLGGSSTINGMTYIRGFPEDYDHWAAEGNPGWSFNDVLPYFKKSENNLDKSFAADKKYHAVGGYQSIGRFPYQDANVKSIVQAYKQLGYKEIDYNANSTNDPGVMIVQAFQENGERRSTNTAFLSPVRDRNNLKVITGVRATRILIHAGNKTAYGVEYVSETERRVKIKAFASREVILSGGVFGSPQLLMLSGIGPKDALKKLGIDVIQDLKVGRNLQDHVGTTGLEYLLNDSCIIHEGELGRDAMAYSESNRGPWSATGVMQVVAFTSSPGASYPDIQYYVLPRVRQNQTHDATIGSPWCYYNKITLVPVVLRPLSRGYVIINSTDPFQQLLVYTNAFKSQHDLDIITYSCKLAMQLEKTEAFQEAGVVLSRTPLDGCTRLEYGTDKYFDCVSRVWTHSVNHPLGTNKMGPSSDKDAVVCPELKVYGVNGLRVVDASTVPFIVSGNLNAAVIMIAEKGTDMIKQSHIKRKL